MPEAFRLYLDQMFNQDIAQALSQEGYNVIRASEIGQARADDKEILDRAEIQYIFDLKLMRS